MRVLVTGGAGYIGSHAVRELLTAGHEPVILDDLSHGYRASIPEGVEFIQGAVGDENILREIFTSRTVDAVMHFAAFIEVAESVQFPERYLNNNFSQPIKLLTAMNEASIKRFIFSSTAAVYGEPVHVPIGENHRCKPINPYGESKRRLELALEEFRLNHGLGYTIFRYFNVAGASPEHAIGEAHQPETHLIPNVLLAALGGGAKINVFGTDYPTHDGTCVRDYVHVVDIALAHILALGGLNAGEANVFNLGSESGYSVKQVIESCRRVTGKTIDVEFHPRRPGDPPILIANSEKVRSQLGWSPRYPHLDTIIEHAWAWHSRNPRPY